MHMPSISNFSLPLIATSQLQGNYDSLANHTPQSQEKEGLVTLLTTTCVAHQDSGATNHLRCFEMCGVTSSNARC